MLEQDKEICLRSAEAVKNNGNALRYVLEQDKDKDIYLEAVRQDGYALLSIKEQDKDICLRSAEAVRQNRYVLKYVKEQYKDICLAAIRKMEKLQNM